MKLTKNPKKAGELLENILITKEIIQHYGLKEEDIDKSQMEKYAEEQIIAQKTFNYIYLLYSKKQQG